MSKSTVTPHPTVVRLADHRPDYLSPRARLDEHLAKFEAGELNVTALRRRWPGENNSHRDMLQRRRMDGFTVAKEFMEFPSFLKAMGPKPGPKHTLDRKDPYDLEYGPGKCQWASKKEQTRNRRCTVNLRCPETGIERPLGEWAERLNVKVDTLHKRRRNGWTDLEIIAGKRLNAAPPSPAYVKSDTAPAVGAPASTHQWRPASTLLGDPAKLFARMNRDDLKAFVPWPHLPLTEAQAEDAERLYYLHRRHRDEPMVEFAHRWFARRAFLREDQHEAALGDYCHEADEAEQEGRPADEAMRLVVERFKRFHAADRALALAARRLHHAWTDRFCRIAEQEGRDPGPPVYLRFDRQHFLIIAAEQARRARPPAPPKQPRPEAAPPPSPEPKVEYPPFRESRQPSNPHSPWCP